jgi:DegV family protein with EDD domain
MVEHQDNITVLNSKTLCGPQRTLVKHAKQMADHHASLTDIVKKLNQMIESSKSFLIPQDFDYLRRGGRLSYFSAFVGKAIRLVPIMTLTKDRKQLCNFAIKRNFKKAIQEIIEHFNKEKLDIHHKLFVSHSIAPALAEIAQTMLKDAFPRTDVSVLHLSPAFTTQGGPGCIAIQSICME